MVASLLTRAENRDISAAAAKRRKRLAITVVRILKTIEKS
jgi:hypothetical protein